MRYVLLGVCLLTAACGQLPSAPSSLPPLPFVSGAASAVLGSDLPFKGVFSATESVAGPLHNLTGEGIATHLGGFTITSSFNVAPPPVGAIGTATWTASDGDQLLASTAGTAVIAFPAATITETHTITGGTGRFANASGTLIVERLLDLQSLASTATVTGSLTLDR
jgi:hypothetical protein